LKIAQIGRENYEDLERIIRLYPEFKMEQKYTRSEFLKLSAKYGHDEEFLRETFKLFKKHKKEF